ncbi:hypothetical protein OWR29_00085 [Actinoplanes sp. Pm04-4]|uniref:DUF2867 domain-containing protein n=1 Tax=Paractinoplanes pyxinae TaxID=2997416 RepID=A0ABT4ASQ2_9ACTN|nr:hypothetical protein [Actinoplanes pyxinae]MCY1136378.1 hypothetical protein [Actinoplanes pyxinae]
MAVASPLFTIHYTDRFVVGTDRRRTPEEWARAIFGDVPNAGEVFIWRVILGLRLSRSRSAGTVAGWRIAGRSPQAIRLEAASSFMTANLVVRAADGEVSLSTYVRYDRARARLIWGPLSVVHKWLAPRALVSAASGRAVQSGSQ